MSRPILQTKIDKFSTFLLEKRYNFSHNYKKNQVHVDHKENRPKKYSESKNNAKWENIMKKYNFQEEMWFVCNLKKNSENLDYKTMLWQKWVFIDKNGNKLAGYHHS